MKTPVVAVKNRSSHIPLCGAVTGWLLLDRLHVAGWVWGVWGTIMLTWGLGAVVALFKQEERTPLWEPKKPE